ncbi:MAG: HEAT repeat domain-containing protein [Vicinamibacterales bacterium]
MIRVSLFTLVGLASGATALAAQPAIGNGRLDSRPASALQADVRTLVDAAVDAVWIGYAVPAASDDRMCCATGADGCCGTCGLERDRVGTTSAPAPPRRSAVLERPATVLVLLRAEARHVDRIRTFSADCVLDAGGRVVHWLTGVRADESLALLDALVASGATRELTHGALTAIAQHAGDAPVDRLIAHARTAPSSQVRSQALFWLSQRATAKAIGAVVEAVDRDPETEVKRRAVFAISQLPATEAVPRLIELARSHSNRDVRKQAIFWLGQSSDPRALAFFAELLGR